MVDSAIVISYYMRGAVQLDSMWHKTPFERDRLRIFLEKRLKAEGDKPPGIPAVY